MSNRNDIDLRGAIPETPDMCRDAVLQAVSTYREEKTMRRTYKVALIAAIVSVLMCGAAFAIAQYYSVREYVAAGNPSAAFEEAIVPVEQSVESNGLVMTLGDAVCDGKNLIFTMDIVPQEDAQPVYVYPELSASCNGETVKVDYYGFDFAYGSGAIIPALNPDGILAASRRGVESELLVPVQSGTIDWTYTLRMYKPTGKLVEAEMPLAWEGEESSDWTEYCRKLCENGEIAVYGGNSIGDYLLALNSEDGLTEAKRAEKSGLFELADTVEFEFSTEITDDGNLVNETMHVFDGYTVAVKSVTTSFMQVNYELEVVFDAPQPSEHEIEQFYVLSDQNGNVMPWRNSALSLAEDDRTCKVWGSVERITDEPVTQITFTLDHRATLDASDTAEDMPSFTIKISD